MKILMIRHGKVDFQWERKYTPEEYDRACRSYDEADILPVDHSQETGDYERIYVSSKKRSILTAQQMFPSASGSMIIQTPLLDEVPIRAYTAQEKQRPKWMYDVRGRLQWRFGNGKRQDETYDHTRRRADELIALLEEKNENAILITHGFFMNVLISRLKKRKRYEVYRASTFMAAPLEKIKVTDKQPHCGGCHHNCLLANAGCVIGQDKARKAGIIS